MRWRVAGRDRSRSFVSRALADGYRAELVGAARNGLAFASGTGEPEAWAAPGPEAVTWYQHAMAYAEMKWPRLAPHSRASLADALATVTPLLTRDSGRRPAAGRLRAALCGPATMILTAACPRTGSAWTSTGTPFQRRGLKHCPDGTIRIVPIPAILAGLLRQHLQHLAAFGTAPDGRLFRGARGGMLSESVYGRAWHAARRAAFGPDLAATGAGPPAPMTCGTPPCRCG